MALRLTLFNSPKHKVFNYQPLYFDPEKEKREQRRAQFHFKKEEETQNTGASIDTQTNPEIKVRTREERLYYPGKNIRGSFQRALSENRRSPGDNRFVRIVLILSIVILFIAAIYLADGMKFLFNALSYQ